MASLEEYMVEEESTTAKVSPVDNSQEGSLTRFDEKPKKRKNKKKQGAKNVTAPENTSATVIEGKPNKEKEEKEVKEKVTPIAKEAKATLEGR